MSKRLELTSNEKTLRAMAMMTILRDDLEELPYRQRMKQITNKWLKEANKMLEDVSSGGEEVQEEWMRLVLAFESFVKMEREKDETRKNK